MATLWSLATLACALAESFGQMFAARFFVGVGEAACGRVGFALIISVFPPRLRSTLTGTFMAGGAVGSVLGMALGGIASTHFGWGFGGMGLFGLAPVALYALLVTEERLSPGNPESRSTNRGSAAGCYDFKSPRRLLAELSSSASIICAYVGSGLQLFIMASMIAWLPRYANRYYGLPPDKSGLAAAALVLIGALGMTCCGIITEQFSRNSAVRKWLIAMSYSMASCALLLIGFQIPAGPAQFAFLGLGMFFVAGTTGPAGATVANLTHISIHATAFATFTLANNLLGMAPGPFITGMVADRIGLLNALQLVPLVALAAASAFAIGYLHYPADVLRLGIQHDRHHS